MSILKQRQGGNWEDNQVVESIRRGCQMESVRRGLVDEKCQGVGRWKVSGRGWQMESDRRGLPDVKCLRGLADGKCQGRL